MLKAILALYLINHAGLSHDRMNDIKKSIDRLFADAEVEILWSDKVISAGGIHPYGTVNILLTDAVSSKPSCNKSKSSRDALGCAFVDEHSHRGNLAYVFVKLIEQEEAKAGMPSSDVLLPRVIAHEVGHLFGLAHTNGHEGIMRNDRQFLDPRKILGVRWTKSERKALFDTLQTAE